MYGPLACALSYIIHCGNQGTVDANQCTKARENQSHLTVFRGLQATAAEIHEKYSVGSTITLQGFTSTTLSRETALSFATADYGEENATQNEQKLPLLMEISFRGHQQHFFLTSNDLSAYPEEEEVLLQDGVSYTVNNCYESEVTCPDDPEETRPRKLKVTVVQLQNRAEKYSAMNRCERFVNLLVN